MKALVKTRPEPGASLERRPQPTLGPNDVLVRVEAASICGTDLHIYSWDPLMRRRIHPPLVFGHEFCGTVEAVGSEVEAIKPGQFVSAEMHVACGHCLQCRIGQQHICQNLKIIGIVHTVLAGEIAGQTVAVVGCGPIGLMAIQVAKACGASAIYGIEVKPHRLELAQKVGAVAGFNPKETDVVAAVREATAGAGADVVLEMSGNPGAIQQAFKMLRGGGRLSLLGLPTEPVTLDLVPDVIFKGATVQGIYGRRMYDTWYRMLALLKAGALNLDLIISDRLPLEQFEKAFDLLGQGQASKVLLYPNGVPT
jgi:threonine 3-dehydrogenase